MPIEFPIYVFKSTESKSSNMILDIYWHFRYRKLGMKLMYSSPGATSEADPKGHGTLAGAVKAACLCLWLSSSNGVIRKDNLNAIGNKLRALILKKSTTGGNHRELDATSGRLFYSGERQRTCIVLANELGGAVMPQFCGRDLTPVLVSCVLDSEKQDIVLASVYLPYETRDSPRRAVSDLVTHCVTNGIPLTLCLFTSVLAYRAVGHNNPPDSAANASYTSTSCEVTLPSSPLQIATSLQQSIHQISERQIAHECRPLGRCGQ